MKVIHNQFYVYQHKINNEVFYVGMGCKGRALETDERNNVWKEIVQNSPSFEVEILSWFQNEFEARKLEREQIILLSPRANKTHNPLYKKDICNRKPSKLRNSDRNNHLIFLQKEGYSYRQLARMFKISYQRVEQIIRASLQTK